MSFILVSLLQMLREFELSVSVLHVLDDPGRHTLVDGVLIPFQPV